MANRGEIAVRVIRAAADAGLGSVAVYADPDADALFVTLADEAYALGGSTPAQTYLDVAKILDVAARSGADAVHPGYGFLAENADFAQAVLDAGLVWIGPPPAAITALGDKVQARHIAQKVGAPLVPGTADPVSDAAEVVAFATEFGLPVAIKAAFGGGGRGLKVARTLEEIPELYESAVREAVGAFGRGECFVERYLDRPRHVETQCLADSHGNVVVVSTRDCSLQRRHQKLVEEAPAPFLTRGPARQALRVLQGDPHRGRLRRGGDLRVPRRPGRDDLVPRGQHPPAGRAPRLRRGHRARPGARDVPRRRRRGARLRRPGHRGHSIEFRINAEDPGRGFLPAPGTLTRWVPPLGPGVRVDEGYRAGMTVPGSFDSLVAKIIVTGVDREQALARSRRALAELVVDGMPTVVPFDRVVLDDPAFTAADGVFGVHTRWIETEFDNTIEPWHGQAADAPGPDERERVVVEVGGRRLEVVLPAGLGAWTRRPRQRRHQATAPGAPWGGGGERPERRRADVTDAGHDRQGRGRRRRPRRGGRPGRRARGHEDGAAAHGAPRREGHRPRRRARGDRDLGPGALRDRRRLITPGTTVRAGLMSAHEACATRSG